MLPRTSYLSIFTSLQAIPDPSKLYRSIHYILTLTALPLDAHFILFAVGSGTTAVDSTWKERVKHI